MSSIAPIPRDPDPHGQAALLLVESLMHTLVADGALSLRSAVQAVESAADVKFDVAAELGDTRATMVKSLALLNAIASSLAIDERA